MKVLWFSSCPLADRECSGTGSWLFAMKSLLRDKVDLYNITYSDNVSRIVLSKEDGFTEYVLPEYKLLYGLPSEKNIRKIKEIVGGISPDIIHIWGVELYWSTLFYKKKLTGKVLLEIQGVISSSSDAFWGGLLPDEIRKSFGMKEILKPSAGLSNQYKKYLEKAQREQYIGSFKWISTQSEWTKNQICMRYGYKGKMFNAYIPIRREFYESGKWNTNCNGAPVIYTSSSYFVPLKGMHILIKALSLIVRKYPDARLIIAGLDTTIPWYRERGYVKYLKRLVRENGLESNVSYPGRLNADGIIENLLRADIYVNPSFVESFSVATAEALYLGVPSVLSFAGALPDFNDVTNPLASYYSPMDYADCAGKIIELFENSEKAKMFSANAKRKAVELCDANKVLQAQLSIYNAILRMD